MTSSILSSNIFFLLFIIFSLFVDAHMGHRRLIGAKETMTMRRKLEGNGSGGNKIAAHGSYSPQAGRKTQNEPSKNRPDHETTQGKLTYEGKNTTKCFFVY
ncbi:hypothetical protein Bca4012_056070 [Brassica carinata]